MKKIRISNGFGGLEEVLYNNNWVGKVGGDAIFYSENEPKQSDTLQNIAEKAPDSAYVRKILSESHFDELSSEIEAYFV